MNDNKPPDPREKLIARTLVNSTLIEDHLKRGLPAMLKANGVSKSIRDGVDQFVQPLLDLMLQTESDVIDFARQRHAADVFDAVLSRLEAFGDEFGRMAKTKDQVRLADNFQQFVGGLTDAWRLPMAIELEQPTLNTYCAPPSPANDRGFEQE